uniref:Arachidonate 12-lipoxygenase, 12R-type-like n=1 Tax=Hippocampus comes TaxID=109280 RepID=A0A3Q2YT22_HIPCM
MAEYKLEVTTGGRECAGTFDHILVTLLGSEGQSERTDLDNWGIDFKTGTVSETIRNLLLVKVEKRPRFLLPENDLFCTKITVTTPEGETLLFPCYRWLSNHDIVELRGGKGPVYIPIENIRAVSFIVYVSDHWKDDDFYGYQFLNGVNPCLIKRCSELPPNFPVTEEMVKPFLENGSTLDNEMKKGNIFLCDQKVLSGIPGKIYHGEKLQVPAPLCLLYLNPEQKLMPIAIQVLDSVHQQPSEDNPIFLPSDSETDWLLAKIFIKNANMITHQAISHLKNTHLISESWAMSLLRNVPVIHPIYKLLISHFRWILHINAQAREILLGPKGSFALSSLGVDGTIELMTRAQSELTYSSLCFPEDIRSRGLESIPDFYYRDDGLKIWDIIHRFVKAMVGHFYRSDNEVVKDSELQGWIHEIFTRCFLESKSSGMNPFGDRCPETFKTVEEVVKFITMVIFTVSAQHAAINNPEFDYQTFAPNGSLLLRKPSPTAKGQSSMKTLLETLPTVGETVITATVLFVLTQDYSDSVLLGSYPEEQFQEPEVKMMMMKFQAELSSLSADIKARNAKLVVPYTYLDPSQIDASIIK